MGLWAVNPVEQIEGLINQCELVDDFMKSLGVMTGELSNTQLRHNMQGQTQKSLKRSPYLMSL